MEIKLFLIENLTPSRPERRWLCDVPQLLTGAFAATRTSAKEKAILQATDNMSFYLKNGRLSYDDVKEIRFTEIESTMTTKERNAFTPDWFQHAIFPSEKAAE